MNLSELPDEIQIQIYSKLNTKDIRSLALTNPKIFHLIKSFFLDKEKWIILNNINNTNDIEKLINFGFRYIYLNKRIEIIYNYICSGDNNQIAQIITDKGLYGANFNYGNFQGPRVDLLFPYGKEYKTNITKILVDAPYNFKRKGIKK